MLQALVVATSFAFLACSDARPRAQPESVPVDSSARLDEVPEPIVLAHRGLVRHAPENTLPALAAAVELGLAIEFDIHETKDKRLVVIHDPTVDRTTNGTGEVSEMTLAEIQRLDAGSWFHPRFAGVRVPTLEEAFQLVSDRQRTPTTIALHLKLVRPGIETRVATLVERYDLVDQLFVFGQPLESTRRLKQASPRIRTIEVKIHDSKHFDRAMKNPLNDGLWVTFIPSRDEIDRAHELGKVVWLGQGIRGNRPDLWDRARAHGMDALCTDWPLACRRRWLGETLGSGREDMPSGAKSPEVDESYG